MPAKMTFASAKARLQELHPNLTLLSFTGSMKPMRLICPVHGEVEVSRAASILVDGRNCPECGKQKAKENLTSDQKALQGAREKALEVLKGNDLLRQQGLYPPRRLKLTEEQFNQINQKRTENNLPALPLPKYLQQKPEKPAKSAETLSKKDLLLQQIRERREQNATI